MWKILKDEKPELHQEVLVELRDRQYAVARYDGEDYPWPLFRPTEGVEASGHDVVLSDEVIKWKTIK